MIQFDMSNNFNYFARAEIVVNIVKIFERALFRYQNYFISAALLSLCVILWLYGIIRGVRVGLGGCCHEILYRAIFRLNQILSTYGQRYKNLSNFRHMSKLGVLLP